MSSSRLLNGLPALTLLSGAVCALSTLVASAQQPKDAEPSTREANAALLKQLPFDNRDDFDDARRGFIGTIPDGLIGPPDKPVWTMKPYEFLNRDDPPPTVNPSLWRQAQLNSIHGLFKVVDRVYQVRGLDLANMTIIEADEDLIVIDPMLVAESAKASIDLYFQHRPRKPILAVIYSHSHADHFGGVKGVVSEEDVRQGKVTVIAPDGFMEHAIAENIIAGNAMSRRSLFQFGTFLPKGDREQVDTGLGKTVARGTITLIPPTDLIKETYETRTIGGIEIEFHLVPFSEAPAEMIMYFPQFRLLNMAEDTSHHMHNLYTIRGAQIRDGRLWSKYIGEALARYGARTDVLIAQHHWPTWGQERISQFLRKQRDLYKFVHDQSVRLLNHGYTSGEISERLQLPPSLAREWFSRGYYGTLSHNSKGVYQFYLGWYDANPANLNPLPPVESARKTVDYMGGAEQVLKRAREDFKAGNYRWVASVLNDVIFADPNNKEARELAADALEQLGYQAEAGTWRNAYLVGAMELRQGAPKATVSTVTPDTLKAVSLDLFFDFMAVRLNSAKADGKVMSFIWNFTDTGQVFTLNLENSALTHVAGKTSDRVDLTLTLTRATLDAITLRQKTFADAVKAGEITTVGDPSKLGELMGMLDQFDPLFKIVEPN